MRHEGGEGVWGGGVGGEGGDAIDMETYSPASRSALNSFKNIF